MRKILSLVGVVAMSGLLGCGKPNVSDDFSDLASQDVKSDAFSKKLKLVGSLDYGQSATADYTKHPRYRAFKFAGQKGDKVDIRVRSTDGAGDPVAWLVTDSYKILSVNDDSDGTTDSHITATLPGNTNPDIVTYMIIFRDYWLDNATFTVSLDGPAKDLYSCKTDSDCVAISKGGCCPNGWNVAVNQSSVDAYNAANACADPHPICPLYLVNDTRVAECNGATQKCEMVAIADIKCGGFIANHHLCPDHFSCSYDGHVPDLPGTCVADAQACGGIAGIPCPAGQVCVDNPNDSCDPSTGGADCGGLCQTAP